MYRFLYSRFYLLFIMTAGWGMLHSLQAQPELIGRSKIFIHGQTSMSAYWMETSFEPAEGDLIPAAEFEFDQFSLQLQGGIFFHDRAVAGVLIHYGVPLMGDDLRPLKMGGLFGRYYVPLGRTYLIFQGSLMGSDSSYDWSPGILIGWEGAIGISYPLASSVGAELFYRYGRSSFKNLSEDFKYTVEDSGLRLGISIYLGPFSRASSAKKESK